MRIARVFASVLGELNSHPPPQTDAPVASATAARLPVRFTDPVSTPLTTGGRSLLLSDRTMFKLARSSDTNDRVAPQVAVVGHGSQDEGASHPQVEALVLVHPAGDGAR